SSLGTHSSKSFAVEIRRPLRCERYCLPSAFAQNLLAVAKQRRQNIADDRARAGLDLHRHRHAGGQLDHPVVDLHFGAVERDARAVAKLLALRLAGLVRCPQRTIVGTVLLPVTDDSILRDSVDLAVQKSVTGKVEGVDLDLGFLSGVDEANVAV